MAELVMDDPLAVSPSRQLAKYVQDIADCIGLMRDENSDSGSPIIEDSSALQRFCVKLEYVLQLGLRARGGVFSKQKHYWDYMITCLSGNKQLNSGITYVKSLSELRTSVGRGRAFIRFCLMQKCLADSVQQCWAMRKITNEWFHAQSIWRSRDLFTTLISVLYDLNELPFDLSLQGYDLDTSWPTFSRNSCSGSNRSWLPPSRSISISSFDNSFSLLPDVASSQPEHLSLDNSFRREDDMATRSVEELEKAVTLAERLVDEYKAEMKELQQQFCTKSDLWSEKESTLQKQLASYKDIIQKLRERAKNSSGDNATAGSDELGLQVEYSAALEAELESVQQDLASRKEVDEKKAKLIEQLDSRVGQLEKRLVGLMSLLETCCRGNDYKTQQLTMATTTVEQLTRELEENQNVRKSLETTVKELRVMLHSVEDKGTKIGQLAKSKLMKYSSENKQLTQTLAERDVELEQLKAQLEEIGVVQPFTKKPVRLCDYTDSRSEVTTGQCTVTCSLEDGEDMVLEYEEDLAEILAASGCSVAGREIRKQRICEVQTDSCQMDYDDIIRERDKLQTTMCELQENLLHFKNTCSKQSDELTATRTLCDHKETHVTKLAVDIDILQGQLSAVEERNRELDLELTRTKRTASDKADEATAILSQDVARVTSELAAVRDLLALKETELLTTKAMCQQEVSALKFQHSSEQMQYSHILKNYSSQQDDICRLMEKVTQQELTINSLETQIEQLQQEYGAEKEQQLNKLSDVRHELALQVKESKLLSKQLDECQQTLTEKDIAITTAKMNLAQQRENDQQTHGTLKQQICTLEADNTDLKKRLIQLIRQKDNLWQKTDQLEFQQRQRGDTWMQDDLVLNCLSCNVEFSFLLRKHHCRLCGRIYCHDCSANWVMTAHSSKKERVCETCFLNTSHTEVTPTDESGTESDTDLLQSIEIPERKSIKWGLIPQLSSDEKDEDDDVVINKEEDGDVNRRTDMEPVSTSEQMAEIDITAHPRTEDDTPQSTKVDTNLVTLDSPLSPEVDVNGEMFDLITDEEIAQSLLASARVTEKSEPLRAEELSEVGKYEHEVCVEARGQHTVDILITQPLTRLYWQFTTERKGINFGASFCELHGSSPDGATELIALCKCNSHKDIVCGDLQAHQPGIYTLTFDNTYSRLTSKNLRYELSVSLP